MKKVFLKSIKELICLTEPIISVGIENPIYYRNLAYNLSNEIIFSEQDQPLDIDKYLLVIDNPFGLNINDTRLLKLMYKKLERFRNDETNARLSAISRDISEVVYDLCLNLDVGVEITSDLDFQKILSSIGLRFVDPTVISFVDLFIKYLKVYLMLSSVKAVISFGLLSVFDENELEIIAKEIELLDIHLIDFTIQRNHSKTSFLVDKEWCII